MGLRAVVVRRRRWRDAELLGEISPELPHGLVIARQHRAEFAHGGGGALLRAELAGLDVGRVGGVEDGDDRRIVERNARGWCGGAGSEHEGRRRPPAPTRWEMHASTTCRASPGKSDRHGYATCEESDVRTPELPVARLTLCGTNRDPSDASCALRHTVGRCVYATGALLSHAGKRGHQAVPGLCLPCSAFAD